MGPLGRFSVTETIKLRSAARRRGFRGTIVDGLSVIAAVLPRRHVRFREDDTAVIAAVGGGIPRPEVWIDIHLPGAVSAAALLRSLAIIKSLQDPHGLEPYRLQSFRS